MEQPDLAKCASLSERCFIALGGNLGPVRKTLDGAIELLRDTPGISVVRVSSYVSTQPVGDHAGGEFLNAVAELTTDLLPEELLDALQRIETQLGRTRELHWGPRTLDLDVVFHGNRQIDTPRLRVPHPACWYRRFVLDPLVEIAPEFVHPVKRRTLRTLRERLLERPLKVALAGGNGVAREMLRTDVAQGFGRAIVDCYMWPGHGTAADSAGIEGLPATWREPTFLVWLGPDVDEDQVTFEQLPDLPRIDATRAESPLAFVRQLLHAALGD